MTAAEYRNLRESIGTPTQVAKLLGVSRMTIHNRESGKHITAEAAFALRAVKRDIDSLVMRRAGSKSR